MKFIHLSDLHIGKHLYHYNMKEDQELAEQLGADGFLLKPVNPKDAHFRIRQVLGE